MKELEELGFRKFVIKSLKDAEKFFNYIKKYYTSRDNSFTIYDDPKIAMPNGGNTDIWYDHYEHTMYIHCWGRGWRDPIITGISHPVQWIYYNRKGINKELRNYYFEVGIID